MGRNYINNGGYIKRPANSRYKRPTKSVQKTVLGGADKMRDLLKAVDINQFSFKNVSDPPNDANCFVGADDNGKLAQEIVNYVAPNGGDVRQIIIEPIRWKSTTAQGNSKQAHMEGLKYFYKSLEVDLSLCATKGNITAHPCDPIDVNLSLVRFKGSFANTFSTAIAQDLTTFNNTPQVNDISAIKVLMTKRWTLQCDQPAIKCKFFKNMNTIVSQSLNGADATNGSAKGSEDRDQQRYAIVIKFMKSKQATGAIVADAGATNTQNGVGSVLHVSGLVRARAILT